MKKLNIGLFVDTWYPMIDGVINVVNNTAIELSKIANVTVFTCGNPKKDMREYPYKVVRGGYVFVPFCDYVVPTITKKLRQEILNANLDIIHVHSPFSFGKLAIEMSEKLNIPVVGTIHSQYEKDFYRYTKSKFISKKLLKKVVHIFNSCQKVYTPNSKMADLVLGYGFNEKPTPLSNATNLKALPDPKPAFDYFENKYGVSKNETVLLFVGRINKIKNLPFLIDALAKLKEMGQNFKMFFVGSGGDTESLKLKVKKLGLADCVIFTGRVTDEELVFAYARAKLFLFPSLYDTNSLVQIEASSQKTPTVFIRGSVTSGTVEENVNGFMTDNDVDAYAQKIYDVLRDGELYNKVSENCQKDLYVTWQETVDKLYKSYLEEIEKYNKK